MVSFCFLVSPLHVVHTFAEIDPEVDFDSRRAVYFRQMRYGLFVSRSLLLDTPIV